MIVGIIQAKDIDEAFLQVNHANGDCDAFELRLDYLSEIHFDELQRFRDKVEFPLIFTLRAKDQKGFYHGNENDRLSTLMRLSDLNPDYIDLEQSVSDQYIEEIHRRNPSIKIVRSYHNFDKTPSDLNSILKALKHRDCSIYKIVTTASSSIDCLHMLHFIKESATEVNIAAHCMGEVGIPSRILGPIFGSIFQYVSIDESQSPAPGCLSLKTCIDIYRAKHLNPSTKIVALLGDPVLQSLGHIFHNTIFQESRKNAVYVKFQVTSAELENFFKACEGLPFQGFSITMPLKTDILHFVDQVDHAHQNIGALNTLRKEGNTLSGTNTDGIGALNAIEKSKKIITKKMLIIGAGGAARAIATEAKKRQIGQLGIINRTLKNSEEIAKALKCLSYDFNSPDLSSLGEVDFMINTLPCNIEIEDEILAMTIPLMSSKTHFLDINYNQPPNTLKKAAIAQGCHIIDGYEMFVEQALMQQKYWEITACSLD